MGLRHNTNTTLCVVACLILWYIVHNLLEMTQGVGPNFVDCGLLIVEYLCLFGAAFCVGYSMFYGDKP